MKTYKKFINEDVVANNTSGIAIYDKPLEFSPDCDRRSRYSFRRMYKSCKGDAAIDKIIKERNKNTK